ncbi:hypothetical protein KUCAC02_021178, partial [Chaenocephalus aceratus]
CLGELALSQLPTLLPPTVYRVGRKVFRYTIEESKLAFIDHKPIRAIFEMEFPKLESLNGDWLFYKATVTTPLKLQIKAQRKAYMDKQITGMKIVWLDHHRFTQWLLMQRATEVFRRNLLGQREEMAPLRLSIDIREDVDKQEMAIISFYKSRQTKWSRPLRWTLE